MRLNSCSWRKRFGDPQYDVTDYAALKANIKGCLDGIKASAVPLAKAVADVVIVQKSVAAAGK